MQVGPFVLDDAKVAEARERFEVRLPKKDNFSFGEYIELFASDCKSFAAIGKERPRRRRLSREMVRLVYRKYFAALFPHRSNGREREKFCVLKTARTEAKKLPDSGLIKEVAEIAFQNGLGFEKERIKNNPSIIFKSRTILLNGKRCNLSCVNRKWRVPHSGSHRFFARAVFSIAKLRHYDFLIIKTAVDGYPEGYFIIPVAEILRHLGELGYKSLYLPLEKLPVYKNRRPKINFWLYLNAWHLLKNESGAVSLQSSFQAQEPIPASAS